MRGKSFSTAEILRAITLKRSMTWDAVASIIDRPVDSLKQIVHRYRHGWRPKFSPEKTERMIEENIAGKSMAQIARETGVVRSAITNRFKRAGFDAEVRAEYQRKP